METVITDSPKTAAEFIWNGGVVAFPTETVYGLGANVFDKSAIQRIFIAKKRPADNPLIAHVKDAEQIISLTSNLSETAEKLIDKFFPGPLTLVLEKAKKVPLIATAQLETVGVRMPRNELALELLNECNTPLVAPSANLSGKPSPTTWQAVYEDLDGRIDCILKGETTEIGLESTVLDCTGEIPLMLRKGAVTIEQIREIAPDAEVYKTAEDESPRSPGLKHKHYSPAAKVMLVSANDPVEIAEPNSAYIGISPPGQKFKKVLICGSPEEYARSLFDFLRISDREGIETIYCEIPEETGIGVALMDRLERASSDE